MQLSQLMAAVRGVLRDREIARLMPTSNKTEPKAPSPAQRLLAAKQAARRGA